MNINPSQWNITTTKKKSWNIKIVFCHLYPASHTLMPTYVLVSLGTLISIELNSSVIVAIAEWMWIIHKRPCHKKKLIFVHLNISGKSIDNSLTQNYQPLEYENPSSLPKFISRGQSYRAVIGDTIVLPCATQDLGMYRN